MKKLIKLASTLLALGLPVAAQATCSAYQNDTFTLHLPASISVPDSMPVGSVIHRQPFSGTAPAYFAKCLLATYRLWGRYSRLQHPGTAAYHTEVPGIGLRISMVSTGQGPKDVALFDQGSWKVTGKIPSHTSAEAIFYKIGPVVPGTLPAGKFFEQSWLFSANRFSLQLGSATRFIKPVATCDLAAGDVNRTITLPTIKVSQLTGEVGIQLFNLTALCQPDIRMVSFRFTGTPSTGNGALFANTGTASGAGLSLSHHNFAYIPANGTLTQRTRQIATSGGRAVLPMTAAYSRTGAAVKAGTLVSALTVSITYN